MGPVGPAQVTLLYLSMCNFAFKARNNNPRAVIHVGYCYVPQIHKYWEIKNKPNYILAINSYF